MSLNLTKIQADEWPTFEKVICWMLDDQIYFLILNAEYIVHVCLTSSYLIVLDE